MFFEKTAVYYADLRCLTTEDKKRCAENFKFLVSEQRCKMYEKNKNFPRFAAGVLLSAALKDVDVDYTVEETYTTAYGKEYFKRGDIYYNISHGKNFICCGVSSEDIGIDCEEIKHTQNYLQIAKRFFSSEECSAISSSQDPNALFTQIWTMKESFVKYTSEGFSRPINSVVCIPNGGVYNLEDAHIKTYRKDDVYISVCNKSGTFPKNLIDMTQFFL